MKVARHENPSISITQQALVLFFQKVAQKEPSVLDKIKTQSSFRINKRSWSFTLPGLFEFIKNNEPSFSHLSYVEFRKLLYASSVNKSLSQYTAIITIEDNQGKVDESVYVLTWGK